MNIIDTLVTDRTIEDVENVTEKGYYKVADLQRVQDAVKYVAQRLSKYGFYVDINESRTWTEVDIPDFNEMRRYLSNILAIKRANPVKSIKPKVPGDMDMLTWWEANNIEQILLDAEQVIRNIEGFVIYSGQIHAGEVIFD